MRKTFDVDYAKETRPRQIKEQLVFNLKRDDRRQVPLIFFPIYYIFCIFGSPFVPDHNLLRRVSKLQ